MRAGGPQPVHCYLKQRCPSCRSRIVSAAIIGTTLLILCSAPTSADEVELLPQCPAGSHLSSSINQSIPEKCLPCKGGATYMDRPNREQACNPCTKCDSLMVQIVPCSATADAHCECHEGFYKNVEGKCSPKAISPVASANRPYLDRAPIADSSSSADKTEHQLNIVIGLIAAVVVMCLFIILMKGRRFCLQQQRTRRSSYVDATRQGKEAEDIGEHSEKQNLTNTNNSMLGTPIRQGGSSTAL